MWGGPFVDCQLTFPQGTLYIELLDTLGLFFFTALRTRTHPLSLASTLQLGFFFLPHVSYPYSRFDSNGPVLSGCFLSSTTRDNNINTKALNHRWWLIYHMAKLPDAPRWRQKPHHSLFSAGGRRLNNHMRHDCLKTCNTTTLKTFGLYELGFIYCICTHFSPTHLFVACLVALFLYFKS